ncbi:hypothetical protein EPO04_01655 [Patescibacteria group bacterium]|nr:MAG: hypothetical protein EPO04_01655 [Patescibacteria group bacterium]
MYEQKRISIHLILTIFLAIGMVVFGVLAVLAYRDNEYVRGNLNTLVKAESQRAREQQKQQSAEENRKANELPFKNFTADAVDGGFVLPIPKTWSTYYGRNNTGPTQVDFAANPDTVTINLNRDARNTQAFRLKLLRQSQADVVKDYQTLIKQKKVTSKGTKVSGIDATQLEGTIDDQRHEGVVIIVPVRDKTIVLITEDKRYVGEFNTIVAGAKINP